jgi:anti-sigma B factor antagonist
MFDLKLCRKIFNENDNDNSTNRLRHNCRHQWPDCPREECTLLRNLISDLLILGHNRILLNLEGVNSIDSAGFAYLIGSLVSVRKQRGDLKLLNPTKSVWAVLQLFKLHTVFDIREDEAAAVRSFGESAAATATAG